MDEQWIYGTEPENIYQPPSSRAARTGCRRSARASRKQQIWQLVAYVRSMSGLAPTDAAPGRDDDHRGRRVRREPNREPALPEARRSRDPPHGRYARFARRIVVLRIAGATRHGRAIRPEMRSTRPGPQAAHIASLWHLMLGGVPRSCSCGRHGGARRRGSRAPQRTRPRRRLDALAREPSVRDAHAPWRCRLRFGRGCSRLVVLASVLTDRRARRPAARGRAAHRGHRAPVVVGSATTTTRTPAQVFDTANELHIPVGRPVRHDAPGRRRDPQLLGAEPAGKKDLIPGRTTPRSTCAPTQPGVYRGQCAEFCGYQHANMALLVVAEAPDAIRRMGCSAQRAARRGAVRATRDSARPRRLRRLDLRDVPRDQGTTASARTAPDLTHVASRSTLAAGDAAQHAGQPRRLD